MGDVALKLATYEDYAALPDDGRRFELIEGRLEVVPAPSTGHQRVSGNLYLQLRKHVDTHNLGELFFAPVDVILSRHDVVQPDLVYISNAQSQRVAHRGIEGNPDFAVEILSPGSASRDWIRKLGLYARSGIPEYWVVDPAAKSIVVMVLEEGSYRICGEWTGADRITSPTFPDLVLAPQDIF